MLLAPVEQAPVFLCGPDRSVSVPLRQVESNATVVHTHLTLVVCLFIVTVKRVKTFFLSFCLQ